MSKAERIFAAAFDPSTMRNKRSDEYKAGVKAALFNLENLDSVAAVPRRCPYPEGSAGFDAWFYGFHEGKRLWNVNIGVA